MNPTDFGDPDFSSSATKRLTLIQSEISQQLLDGLQWNLLQTFKVPRGYNLITLVTLRLSLWRHQQARLIHIDILVLYWNILTTIRWIAVKFGSDIHVLVRMSCNNFDPLTFPQALFFKMSVSPVLWFVTSKTFPSASAVLQCLVIISHGYHANTLNLDGDHGKHDIC